MAKGHTLSISNTEELILCLAFSVGGTARKTGNLGEWNVAGLFFAKALTVIRLSGLFAFTVKNYLFFSDN